MTTKNLDVLAFAAHPDDVELAASGTLIKHIQMGQACGIIDLTRGELGTRGTADDRDAEAAESSKIMGLAVDHGRAAELVSRACFLAGLPKIITASYEAHRPKAVYHYIQDRFMKPDVIVDISDVFEQKMQTILAFKTQFYNPNSSEPETPISSKEFMEFLIARALEYGRTIGTKYGEGFTTERTLGTNTLIPLL